MSISVQILSQQPSYQNNIYVNMSDLFVLNYVIIENKVIPKTIASRTFLSAGKSAFKHLKYEA